MGYRTIKLEKDFFLRHKYGQLLKRLTKEDKYIELDMINIHFMSSMGIDMAVNLYWILFKREGKLKIINVRRNVLNVFLLTNIQNIINITPL